MTKLKNCYECSKAENPKTKRFTLYKQSNEKNKRKLVSTLIICENLKHITIWNKNLNRNELFELKKIQK